MVKYDKVRGSRVNNINTGKQKTPTILIIAAIMYILPISIFYISANANKTFLFICIIASLAIYHLLTGIGLLFRITAAWWCAIIGPLPLIIFSLFVTISSFVTIHVDDISPVIAFYGTFFSIVIIIYYGIIFILITKPFVKKLFLNKPVIQPIAKNNPEIIMQKKISISKHISVLQNPTNTGIIIDDDFGVLLIDCGAGTTKADNISQVNTVLLTHYHRDGFYDIGNLDGVSVLTPQAEKHLIENADSFWNDLKNRWHLYNYRPSHLVASENIRVDRGLNDGEVIEWGSAKITAISTPGHTDGSMSYLVQVDDMRIAFTGDLIYNAGQIWELLSLQHGDENIWDYHSFLRGKDELIASLRRVLEYAPDILVPTHGVIITNPKFAVDLLAERLDTAWENYISVNTIRSYFPDKFENKTEYLPIRESQPAPACLRHIDTSWILISNTGAAFVMDCGTPRIISELQRMMATGEINAVEGLWITHMHDDHVDTIPDFQDIFICPLYADPAVADVIADPRAWRLPCISPNVARVDCRTGNGESWQWHEFRLTAYNFPGQTLYHDGLMVESTDGPRMFFVGDSFALAGMDDYCAHNRNFLGTDVGFDFCISLLQKLQPDLLFNPHVDGGFNFSADEYQRMRDNLAVREKLYSDLFPWQHPNFATDDFWARCHPYEQDIQPGDKTAVNVIITNHSNIPQTVTVQANARCGWQENESVTAVVQPKVETAIPITIHIPEDLPVGRYVVTINVQMGEISLPAFIETLLIRTFV